MKKSKLSVKQFIQDLEDCSTEEFAEIVMAVNAKFATTSQLNVWDYFGDYMGKTIRFINPIFQVNESDSEKMVFTARVITITTPTLPSEEDEFEHFEGHVEIQYEDPSINELTSIPPKYLLRHLLPISCSNDEEEIKSD